VKLLFDQNLSYKLVAPLDPAFPGTSHVLRLGLDESPDTELREYAAREGFTLVTKNTDLVDLCVFRGAPPKVIWLRVGNCSTAVIRDALQSNIPRIIAFGEDPLQIVLSIFRLSVSSRLQVP
jgi:predicted nuclease of predicted toxin-antitoxin system